MAPTTVLIFVPCLLVGGTEMHTLLLTRALVGGGYRVTVCAYHEHDPVMVRQVEEAGARVRLLGLPRNAGGRNFSATPRLARALLEIIQHEQPRFVHVQYMTPGLAPILTARAAGVPRVLATVHVPARHYGRGVWLPRAVARACDAFLCVSLAAERSFFGSGALFTPDQLRHGRSHFTIHNCVDVAQVDAARSDTASLMQLKQSLGLTDSTVVGMVSRLSAEKGPLHLLDAMGTIARQYAQARLLVVGDGAQRQELQAKAQTLGIADRIIWAGRLDRHNTFKHMAIMDVVAVPSLWEGFGLTAAEAMAFEKPVVASAVDGLSEVVTHNQTGFLVPPASTSTLAAAISSLLDNEPRRMAFGQAGRARVESNFSFQTFARHHIELYDTLNTRRRQQAGGAA